jgi:hypothetical protein
MNDITKKMNDCVKGFKNFKYMAIDGNGDIYIYRKKPYIDKEEDEFWSSETTRVLFLAKTFDEDLRKNWKKTLTKIG